MNLHTWILLLAISEAGWMAFDGARALIAGDYTTPSAGPRAGELGPWSRLVAAAGIPPRSTGMKIVFVAYGLAWLAIAICYSLGLSWAPAAMLVAAIGALWYLPVGTVFSIIQIVLSIWLARG